MDGASILIIGMLVVAGMLAITSAIYALAPYIAGGIVVTVLFWIYSKFDTEQESPPEKPPVVKPKIDPRE